MTSTKTMYTIKSIKTQAETAETLDAAIERAREIDAEYQPAFGVQIEGANGERVWDSENQDGDDAPVNHRPGCSCGSPDCPEYQRAAIVGYPE